VGLLNRWPAGSIVVGIARANDLPGSPRRKVSRVKV